MIDLHLSKKLFTPKLFPYLFDYSVRWECYMGSAGAAKSYFITQKIIIRCLNEPIRALVCRRYGSTIRNSCFSLFKDILKKWKISQYIKINESDMKIVFPNGSEIIFMGLDDEGKLLSLHNISVIFIEEAFEVSQDMVEQLNLRMRGTAENQQIILAWNPISSHSWLYKFVEEHPDSFRYIHTTYKDNPFLSQQYIDSLEELYIRNPQKARIFCDGEWGVDTEGLVFSNWKVEGFDINKIAKLYEHRCGMDFGYNDPSAIVETFYDKEHSTIYITNEFYRTGQTLDNIYNAISRMNLLKSKIQCDSAEPRTIDFFKRKGINAVPCIKGQNSVEARIMFLQNNLLVVHPSCENVITELSNFSYIKDNRTGKYSDKMTHEYSHSIDAIGYAYSDIYTGGRIRTLSKSILGL